MRLLRHPTFGLLLATVVAQGVLVATGILVVRLIGVDARGEYAQVYSVLVLCSLLGLAGIPSALVYFAGRPGVRATDVLRPVRGTVLMQVGTAVGAALLLMLLMASLGDPLAHRAWETALVTVGVAVVMAAQIRLSVLQADHRFRVLPVVQLIAPITYVVALLVMAVFDAASVPSVLAALLVGWGFVAVAGHLVSRDHSPHADAAQIPSGAEVRRFARRALVSGVAPADQLGIDQLLIGVVLGHLALGYYVIGFAFETATVLPLVALSQFIGPRVATTAPISQRSVAARWLLIAALLGLAICGVLQLLLGDLVVLAFGAEARPAVPVARLLVLAGVLLGLRRVLGVILANMGRPRSAAAAEVAAFVTMVIGVLLGGSTGGVVGACAGLLCGGLVGTLVQGGLLWRGTAPVALSNS